MVQKAHSGLRIKRPSQVYQKAPIAPAKSPGASQVVLIGIFVCLTWLPLAGLALGLDSSYLLNENRTLATKPVWTWDRASLAEFPRKYEAYFNDHFGFRKRLIRWLSIAKVTVLGTSSSPDVLIGKNGWLFYSGAGALDYYRSTRLFKPDELEQWRQMFEGRREWLSRRGIRYLVVIAPNKETIYPEFVPGSLNRVRRVSRQDQLLKELQAHSVVTTLDLRAPLLRAKGQVQVYHLTDTHWNMRGAFIAYQEIMNSLSSWFPSLAARSRSDYSAAAYPQEGDLAQMLGLKDQVSEEVPALVPRAPRLARPAPAEARMPPGVPEWMKPFATECDDEGLPRAVMFRDSFGTLLTPFLSEHFRRIVYAWKYPLDRELIERERPDVVIHEIVERSLMLDLPAIPYD